MTIHHIPDGDNKGITAVFYLGKQKNDAKSKLAGRPIFDDIEMCHIYYAGFSREKQLDVPAHSDWTYKNMATEWGTTERRQVTYAERFSQQYREFKAGGAQTFSGTPLSEAPFLTEAKRSELRALRIYTVETLAAMDGTSLKMLGPGGRDLKNQAVAYIEAAQKGVAASTMADELAKRDAEIAEMKRKLESLAPNVTENISNETKSVSADTIEGFSTFEDDDLKAWLANAGVTVDGRWKRARLIQEADDVLQKQGKKNQAAA